MRGRGAALVVAIMFGASVVPARAHPEPSVVLAWASVPTTPEPGAATDAMAVCGSGTQLTGGGVLTGRVDPLNPTPLSAGLRARGSAPADLAGGELTEGALDPQAWSATAGFAQQAQRGNQVTSFAVCATAPFVRRVVSVAKVVGPTGARARAQVTATCPAGTVVLGGGAHVLPDDSPALKPVSMYPSDAAGAMPADGALNPTSWTVVSLTANEARPDHITTAYAVCGERADLTTRVARTDRPGPSEPATTRRATAACGSDHLLGGGAGASVSAGVLQFGLHLLGSYPSNLTGAAPVTDITDPEAWSAVMSSGGLATPNTTIHAFAICALRRPAPELPAGDRLAVHLVGPVGEA